MWQCKEYKEKGVRGCASPSIYTKELDEIMRQGCEMLIENKAEIIHDMLKIYKQISNDSNIKIDISKTKNEILEVVKKKDKLLELNIKNKINDEEFEERNNYFNNEVQDLKKRLEQLEEDELKSKQLCQSVDKLKSLITNELDFKDGLNGNLIDSLLDRIEVYKCKEPDVVELKVFFKIVKRELNFLIKRRGRNNSVCISPYTC